MRSQTYPAAMTGRTRVSFDDHRDASWWGPLEAWARFHGIDPSRISTEGWIEVDHARHTISYTVGQCTLCELDGLAWQGCRPLTESVQGEGPPLLLPEDVPAFKVCAGPGWKISRVGA